MTILKGITAAGGIAIGRLKEFIKETCTVERKKVSDTNAELLRFEDARQTAMEQLKELYDSASERAGEEEAAIFEVHQMLLDDEDYIDSVKSIISGQSFNAEFAVESAGANLAAVFSNMDDDYMKERAADIKDISDRVIRILSGSHDTAKFADDGGSYILVSDDLAPSETVQLDRKKVLAFITRKGSSNSHTAILARTMNIPALVCVPMGYGLDGVKIVTDGDSGRVFVDPDTETLEKYEALLRDREERKALFRRLKNTPPVTKDGQKIKLYANIGGPDDVEGALQNGAGGVGLFRSEFLYLKSDTFPTEEEQFTAYKTVAEKMAGKEIVIRTMDIGADKQIDYLNLKSEANPALGRRAIRICLNNEELFKTQLRAIYRASAYGNILMMFPMIASLWEVQKAKKMAVEVMRDLKNEGTKFENIPIGIMVETPAAVMIADELAKEVDFFSIGTNDLTQYTLAVDRQNADLGEFFDPHHPAVLKMIQMTAESAHRNGIWVGICGELGADTSLTETFVRMGIDELSVSAPKILPVLDKIINISLK